MEDSWEVASCAKGPFGCMVSDVLVVNDNEISLVLKDLGTDIRGSGVLYRERGLCCVKGVEFLD